MMDFLQWAATACVIVSYYFMVTRPSWCVYISLIGCSLMGLWAMLLSPAAYGVLTLELFVIAMGIRNLIKLRAGI